MIRQKHRAASLAMANDLRIVLLRWRRVLQTLCCYAASKAPGPEPIARETMRLYAPLANRLGIWQLKWELEDLSFRFLEPGPTKRLRGCSTRIGSSARTSSWTQRRVCADPKRSGNCRGRGRPTKHIYSIVNKMRTKGLAFDQREDVRGLRVIVDADVAIATRRCRRCIRGGQRAGEYDDYIARPKPNGYQSLHTVVTDEHGRAARDPDPTRGDARSAELGVGGALALQGGRRGASRGTTGDASGSPG